MTKMIINSVFRRFLFFFPFLFPPALLAQNHSEGPGWNLEKLPETKDGRVTSLETFKNLIYGEQIGALTYVNDFGQGWYVPGDLKQKTNEQTGLCPFFGDTVTLPLAEQESSKIEAVKRRLTAEMGKSLCPLSAEQNHLTIHDLANGIHQEEVFQKIEDGQRKKKIHEIFEKLEAYLQENPHHAKIKMKVMNLYPCMNKSLVFGMGPAEERDFRILYNLHSLFDKISHQNYLFRPHITLAYHWPRELGPHERVKLVGFLNSFNRDNHPNPLTIELDIHDLSYQIFYDMNEFRTQEQVKDLISTR